MIDTIGYRFPSQDLIASKQLGPMVRQLEVRVSKKVYGGGVTPFYILHLCVKDLFIEGLLTLHNRLQGMVLFQNKGKCLYFDALYQYLQFFGGLH